MQEELKTLINLFNSETIKVKGEQNEIIEMLNNISKKARVNEFLANKYKTDYENTVQFLNQSIKEIELKHEELLRVNMELERFAHVVSHDLKAPLRGVLGFVGLLERELKGTQNERIEEYLAFIKSSSSQMNTLVEETLEYTKLKNGMVKMEEVNLNNTINTVREIILQGNQDSEIQIAAMELPVVYANRAMMHKLFLNFIQNGIKYNRSNLKIIHISYEEKEKHQVFKIIDNGIGIPHEVKEKIFDMYVRLQSVKDFEGTGIGLAICKKIIETHKGHINVDSTPGQGSTFEFSIAK